MRETNIKGAAKVLLALAAAWLLAYGGAKLYARIKEKQGRRPEEEGDDTPVTTGGSTTKTVSTTTATSGDIVQYPLKWGSDTRNSLMPLPMVGKANDVATLQEICERLLPGVKTGAKGPDGIWGAKTEAAVAKLIETFPTLASYFEPVQKPADGRSHWQVPSWNTMQLLAAAAARL